MPPSSERKCVFCHLSDDDELKYGKFYEHDGIVTHYYCLLLSSNMQQRGRDEDGILGFLAADIQKELKRGRRLICSYCKKNGATLGCCNRKCKKVFHYPCGIKNNTLHQFYGQYKSFCVVHRPKCNIDPKIRDETADHLMCYICYDHVHNENHYQTLWAPCCKKNAWFHRDCVQQLALSAGYFFKCPLCNNKKEFQKAMLESGIFIPSQDASWELVPNAFQELLYRHNKCDADICNCPHGREYTSANARWELVLCRTCGSQGIHMECGNLRWRRPIWDCDECATILNKNGTYHNPNHDRISDQGESVTISNVSYGKTDDDSSDSDISVDTESLPLPETVSPMNHAPIVLRPGPRSAKLKQLLRHAETRTDETSGSDTSMEQLKDILNEQQAHHSTLDEVLPSNLPPPVPSLNTHVDEPKNVTPSKSPTTVIDDVIVVESDDDDEAAKQSKISPTNDKMLTPKAVTDCTISYMNIKISEVTSLPPEVFASVPDTSITSTIGYETSADADSTYLMKRKADSSDVVSMIVQRINDSIDLPDGASKKPRLENNLPSLLASPIVAMPMPSVEPQSILRGVSGRSYRNGVSLSQAAIVTVDGKQFVVPLEHAPNIPSSTSNNVAENSTQSNSDGDAGTRRAEYANPLDDDGKADLAKTVEQPRGRGCDDHGVGQNPKPRPINDDESSSRDSDTRANRNRLMRKRVLLRDLKFFIHTSDTITMNYRDKFTMNIEVETKRERKTVNNCSFFCNKNNSRWASRVRGSNSQQNNNKKNDCPCPCGSYNESIVLNNCDIASDIRDVRLLAKDSTHFLANGDIDNLCKYQRKEAAKENLVPDVFEQSNNVITSEKLSSPERISKRLRYENNNTNNKVTTRKYVNSMSVTSDPGTSRDELRELSHSYVNQRYFTLSSNIYTKGNRKLTTWRRKSLSSYFEQYNIRCRVSIDLDRIKSIFDEIPNLMLKRKVAIKYQSFDDLRIRTSTTSTTMKECKIFESLTRSKSESNISSLYNNSSSQNFNNSTSVMNINDLQKRKKAKRKERTIKHDCMR